MKIGKKSYFTGGVLFLLATSIFFQTSPTNIKATDEPASKSIAMKEADLHNQETITIPQMEAYMEGKNTSIPKTSGKMTGSMTKEQYNELYSSLNKQQNTAWNEKYNFQPETKVVHVFDYASFKQAYADNTVSKIILDADAITTETNERTEREESIEIDGQGHLLQMGSGGFNVVDGTTNAFSDEPVFHMHDIQVVNGGVGDAGDGTMYNWSFINGNGQGLGNTGANRSKWRYRLGNVTTPYDSSLSEENHRIRGRLIGANRAEVSMWGYNTIVTGAENFYLGSMKLEPKTWYRGMVGHYNYSVLWFMENTKKDGTETGLERAFDVGEGSFVYLKNQKDNATSYPAVYGFFDAITIGEQATFNANMAGNAARFNVSGSTFTAQKESTVNLLSRSTSYATVGFGGFATNSGSEANPSNLKYEFMPGSNVFIVGGSTTNSVIDMNSSTGSNFDFILDSPESFDIRNTTTSTTKAFLSDSLYGRGTKRFVVKNSDISLWNSTAEMDGAPTFDYSNILNMEVTNATRDGDVTSSDMALTSQFVRSTIKRISGMNTTPELSFLPVTDADLSQHSRVLIGYTAVGGKEPFDENGDAKVKPVYGDDIRKVYVDYTDTLGNVYTGVSSADTFVHWNKEDHMNAGFQVANQKMTGKPYRAAMVDNILTPYRIGELAETTIIDVTPPEPAILTANKITNVIKQLVGKNAEANAKIYLDINGVRQATTATVNEDGTWIFNLPRYLNIGETVQLFLEDHAGKVTEILDPSVPPTNNENGNINPTDELHYRDAVFKPAKKYIVEDGLADNPLMEKTVISSGGKTTQVGDLLTYTLTATNGKQADLDAIWNDVTIKDPIPEGLGFDSKTAEVTLNGSKLTETDGYRYDPVSRVLTVAVGPLQAGESAIVTFKTEVQQAAVGKIIKNSGVATGFSQRESGEFIEGADDPKRPHDVFSKEATVENPGGTIFGVLELVSAPKTINFGSTKFSPKGTTINDPSYEGGDLIVKDGRAIQETWTLNARLEKELAKVDAPDVFIPRAIRYMYRNEELTLMGISQPISSRKNETSDPYNISDTWSPEGDGFKLKVASGQSIAAGAYEATIVWELVTGPPPANP